MSILYVDLVQDSILQCISNGDTLESHLAISMWFCNWYIFEVYIIHFADVLTILLVGQLHTTDM